MKKADIEKRTEELVIPIIERFGYELWDVEYVKEGSDYYLRVYADKEGGFTVDDCEAVSRALDPLLDEEDYISDAYILEVSSPGLLRPFKKDRDYTRNIGNEIEIHLFKADAEKNKEYVGVLDAFDADTVTIELEDGNKKSIARRDISLARPYIDFSDF